MTHLLALPAGTELVGDYRIERVLGAGGFGITYLAEETALARDVTIKEYFPGDFAARSESHDAVPRSQDCAGDYQWGLDRFISEAQILARFDHHNIVRVYRYFRANNTGYMVLQFEEGHSLKSWLKGLGRAPRQKEIDSFLAPLLDALELIHKADFLHRDIAPDNIILRPDGAPVLIDFGSARGDIARHSRIVSALVKPGYSPYEQYAEIGKQQGPWSDIYALAATLYHAITGKRPPDSPSRGVKDELIPARAAALSSYRPGFLAAIDKALSLDIDKRPQSVAEWRGALLAPAPKRQSWLQRTISRRPQQEAEPPLVGGATVALTAPVPPPPDAPAEQGRLLDYIDRLKQKTPQSAASAPKAAAAPEDVPAQPEARAPAPTVVLPKAKAKSRVKAAPAAVAPAPSPGKALVPVKASRKKLARPRKVKTGDERSWWPLGVKLLIGVAIATAAVGLQDRLAEMARNPPKPTVTVAEKKSPSPTPVRSAASAVREPAVTKDVAAVREVQPPRETQAQRAIEPAREAPPRDVAAMTPPVAAPVVPTPPAREMPSPRAEPDAAPEATTRDIQTASIAEVEPPRVVINHPGGVLSLAFTDDGSALITAGADGTLRLWNPETGTETRSITLGASRPTSLAVMGRRALTGHEDGYIQLWDLDRGERLGQFRRNAASVWSVAFMGEPNRFVAASHDWLVTVWDAANTLAPAMVLEGHEGPVQAVAYAPRGLIASGGADRVIRLWDATTGSSVRTYRGHRDFVTAINFSHDGRILASGSLDGAIRLWSTSSQRLFRNLPRHGGRVGSLAFSPSGQYLASASDDATVRVWNFRRARTLRRVTDVNGAAYKTLAFTPDGRFLAASGSSGAVRNWDVSRLLETP